MTKGNFQGQEIAGIRKCNVLVAAATDENPVVLYTLHEGAKYCPLNEIANKEKGCYNDLSR